MILWAVSHYLVHAATVHTASQVTHLLVESDERARDQLSQIPSSRRSRPGTGSIRRRASPCYKRVKQEDPAYLLDRVRVRLRGVARADDVFGIDTVEMRARILDDTVVAALDGPVAGNSNDRMRVDARGNRRRGHRLQDRIVWRYAEQAARSEIAWVDLEIAGIARKFDAGLDNAHGEGEKSPKSSVTGYSVR